MLNKRSVAATLVCLMLPGLLQAQLGPIRQQTGVEILLNETLNFRNVTAKKVMPRVNETTNNEKQLDVGDFDNDGDLDAVMAISLDAFGQRRNKLWRNDNGVMVEVSGTSAITGFNVRDNSRTAFLRDYDNDGWLDIIVINDSNSGGDVGRTKYFSNKHPNGTFSHFEDESSRLNGATGAACDGASDDFNNGHQDLYLGNYPFNSQDYLGFNDGTGNFVTKTSTHVPNDQDYTVDISVADLNGDGKKDLMVSNHFDPSFMYYNDKLGQGSEVGDYKYSGSTQQFSLTNFKNAMEAGDFNGDGRNDVYYSNFVNSGRDYILENGGNNAQGIVNWIQRPMADIVGPESKKSVVADLNNDRRPDIIVMRETRRPVIFRNTSVNGQISFIDWTPGNAFPAGSIHGGWHAAAFDTNGDKRTDIFLGGMNDDHLFEYVKAAPQKEGNVKVTGISNLNNQSPITIIGNGRDGELDSFTASGLPTGASVSIVLRSKGDVTLRVRNASGTLLHESERGGLGIEEAMQFMVPSGSGGQLQFEVIVVEQRRAQLESYVLEILSRNG